MRDSTLSSVVVGADRPPRPEEGRRERGAVLAILGSAFLLVGMVDLALLWFPAHFESVSWEFATVGRTLDGLPMSALGLGLLAYGSARTSKGRPLRLRLLGVGFAVAALLVAILAGLFLTALPTVLRQDGGEVIEGIRRAAVRHGVQAVIYPISFALIARLLWKAGRPAS
ncbi:MAG: hypothetical protein ACE5HP_02930 [Gemmatimonadota bacterium]